MSAVCSQDQSPLAEPICKNLDQALQKVVEACVPDADVVPRLVGNVRTAD